MAQSFEIQPTDRSLLHRFDSEHARLLIRAMEQANSSGRSNPELRLVEQELSCEPIPVLALVGEAFSNRCEEVKSSASIHYTGWRP